MPFQKRNIPWNKGKSSWNKGKHWSEEHKKRMSISKKGCVPWNKGIPRSDETKRKMSETRKKRFAIGELKPNFKGCHHKEETKEIYRKKWEEKYEKGFTNPRDGIEVSEITKQKMSETRKKLFANKEIMPNHFFGVENPNWRGGLSFEPYDPGFNKKLKKIILDRDNHICQLCKQPENGRKLSIHHIDYDKKNHNQLNLVSLCKSCHIKTNYNRDYWTDFFNKYQIDRIIG
jgi:hypothetical protein